jgi:5-oxoprolinase (ATP-hydrolysing) subunit A
VARLSSDAVAVSQSGIEIPMRADCICIHSDTPDAVELAKAIKARRADAEAAARS